MITISPEVMLSGYAVGLFLGTTSSLVGFLLNSAFRWMGY